MEQPKNNLKIVTDKKTNARVILPNMLTLIGVCIGLSSIRFALDGKFEFAIIAIMFAALIDGLDGRIARLIKGTSKVGKELDSLTDMISFGVAPAFIMYFWKLNTLGRFGWLLCLIYVICVALRLARFNVNTGQAPSWRDNFFEGVPSPAGGILVLTPLILSLTSFLTIMALVASDALVVPLQTEFFALEGLTQLMKTIERIKSNLNPILEIRGILLTMYDKRNKLSSQVETEARNFFKEKVYNTAVPRNVRLSEAPSHGVPVLIYDKLCPGSKAYFSFTEEFLEQEKEIETAA